MHPKPFCFLHNSHVLWEGWKGRCSNNVIFCLICLISSGVRIAKERWSNAIMIWPLEVTWMPCHWYWGYINLSCKWQSYRGYNNAKDVSFYLIVIAVTVFDIFLLPLKQWNHSLYGVKCFYEIMTLYKEPITSSNMVNSKQHL